MCRQVLDHCHWDRYLTLVQARTAFAPIKFNGQAFTSNNTGKGWDYRDWYSGVRMRSECFSIGL